jgi:hypothetical protein
MAAGFFAEGMRRAGAGTNTAPRDSLSRSSRMPPWMEILINVIGYAGFIGVAKYHKPSSDDAIKR